LKELGIYFIDDMESLPEVGLQNLSSLGQLWIRGCSRLKSGDAFSSEIRYQGLQRIKVAI
jgi:hypothetical protein